MAGGVKNSIKQSINAPAHIVSHALMATASQNGIPSNQPESHDLPYFKVAYLGVIVNLGEQIIISLRRVRAIRYHVNVCLLMTNKRYFSFKHMPIEFHRNLTNCKI